MYVADGNNIGNLSIHTACGKFPLKSRGLTNKLTTLTSAQCLEKEAKPFAKLIVKWLGKIAFLMDYMNFLNMVVFQVITSHLCKHVISYFLLHISFLY